MKETENLFLFYNGPFSQWYPHDMNVDGIQYNCAEQFMMAMKASHFGDQESLEKIMFTSSPRIQKEIGRKVKNFNPDEWRIVAMSYVIIGNRAKFSDPELREFILSTGNKELVEASPYDKIWGIGLGEDDPRALDKSQWLGTNWLGKALMEVRTQIKEDLE